MLRESAIASGTLCALGLPVMRVVGAARQGRTKTSKTLIPLLVPEFAVTDISKTAQTTTFSVLFAVSFCHLLNDMMQSLIPAIYPSLKDMFHLSFAQIGLITLVFQC